MNDDELVQAVKLALLGEIVRRGRKGCPKSDCEQWYDMQSTCATKQRARVHYMTDDLYRNVSCPLELRVMPDEK